MKALNQNYQIKRKEQENLASLYYEYGKKIYNLAYRIIGNKQEAEDLTQETFLQALQNIDKFQGKSQTSTWLYSIAKNLCYRAYQSKIKTSFASFENLINTAPTEDTSNDLTPVEKEYLIQQIKEGCLTGLLRCLSFYQRTAFIFNVLLHIPVQEVAQIIEKSNGATKVLIHRAKKNLKKFLCQKCSLYTSVNKCNCENLLGFSLKKGWINRPSNEEMEEYRNIDLSKITEDIKSLDKVTELYNSLAVKELPKEFTTSIQKLIKSDELVIFYDKKV